MFSDSHGAPAVSISTNKDMNNPPKLPVWHLDTITEGAPSALQTKCDRLSREGGVCCKDLKGEDNRTLINPDVVRDIVIGLSDGLTVPFALTAGLSSLGQSRFVVMGGLAELIAGAISMGIGGFLAAQAERDHYRFKKRQMSSRIHHICRGEMEREVFSILGPVGVNERTAQAVAKCLRDMEDNLAEVESMHMTASLGDEEKKQIEVKEDVGLTSFLLKFGLGLEEIPTKRLYISAVTIGIGYLVGGIIPLIPYFFINRARVALLYSCIITGVVLLIFGAVKSRVTGAAITLLGCLRGAVSMLVVGGASAAAAYGMVVLLENNYGGTST
ncbi:VIT family-domain-containing protein [Pisolithus marmoratus]|nr:VIT family-domain-containing protein [Pisolithus marmoratus]